MLVSLKMTQLQSVLCALSLTERDLLSLWHSRAPGTPELYRRLAELRPGNWPLALGLPLPFLPGVCARCGFISPFIQLR